MTDKPLPPPNEAAIFEAGYLASTLRARREFTWAQRAAIVSVLTGAAPDPRVAVPETPQPALRSFALILARCESAATLLGWRKQITPEQKRRLDPPSTGSRKPAPRLRCVHLPIPPRQNVLTAWPLL